MGLTHSIGMLPEYFHYLKLVRYIGPVTSSKDDTKNFPMRGHRFQLRYAVIWTRFYNSFNGESYYILMTKSRLKPNNE
jgi:hypothetical protein